MLVVRDLKKWFPVRKGFLSSIFGGSDLYLKAVDGVGFEINDGEIFGLVGESGSGKTTVGRLLVRLLEPTAGNVIFNGTDIFSVPPEEVSKVRKRMQIIFQDPFESLNPKMTVFDVVSEPLILHKITNSETEKREMVKEVLNTVQLTPAEEFMFRYPHELSGGQRQRVAVARALVLKPGFIVADEPVSMLDVSMRTEVLNLMLELRDRLGLSILFITHDLAVAKYMCDRIAVMYLGKIVEMADEEELIRTPQHPYTMALIKAVPVPNPRATYEPVRVKGEIPSPINPPQGCPFHPRCPIAVMGKCNIEEPELLEVRPEHRAACFFPGKEF